MKEKLKQFFHHFLSIWVQIIVFNIPLYISLYLNRIPIQLAPYLKLFLFAIAIITRFKNIKVLDNPKKLVFVFIWYYITFFIFAYIFQVNYNKLNGYKLTEDEFVNTKWLYFSKEWVYYYFDNFPNKVWIDFNNDWFVDLIYNEKENEFYEPLYDLIWLLLRWLLALIIINLLKSNKKIPKIPKIQKISVIMLFIWLYYIQITAIKTYWNNLRDILIPEKTTPSCWDIHCAEHVFTNTELNLLVDCIKNKSFSTKCKKLYNMVESVRDGCSFEYNFPKELRKNCNELEKVATVLKENWLSENDMNFIGQENTEKENKEEKTNPTNENLKNLDIDNLFNTCYKAFKSHTKLEKNCENYIKKLKSVYLYNLCLQEKSKTWNTNWPLCKLYNDRINFRKQKGEFFMKQKWLLYPLVDEETENKYGFQDIWANKSNSKKKAKANLPQKTKFIPNKPITQQKANKNTKNNSIKSQNINQKLQKIQNLLDKAVTSWNNPENLVSPEETQYILTYKKYIEKTKDFADILQKWTQKIKKELDKITIDNTKAIDKFIEETVKKYKSNKDAIVWKKFLLEDEYKVHKVLKENAKTINEYKKEVKIYQKKYKKLQEEINKLEKKNKQLEEAIKEAEEIKKYSKIKKIFKALDKIQTAVSIFSEAADFQEKAKAEWVKLSDGTAVAASALNNTIWNVLNDNPYDQAMQNIWDIIEKIWDKLWSDKLKSLWQYTKNNLTIWWQVKKAIEFAVTTDEETFKNMEKEYDNVYKEEIKNAWTLKKWLKFIQYKVVWKAYYRWIRWVNKWLKLAGWIINKVKSWF